MSDWKQNMADALAAGGCTSSKEWAAKHPSVHCWFDFKGTIACVLCGLCQAHDATKQKPCRGIARISLRTSLDDDGKPGSGQSGLHETQQGADTPGQRASAAAGNVADPHHAPDGIPRGVEPSSSLSLHTRKALGWTQSQLAHVLGVHSLTISKWERGKLDPSPYQESLLRNFAYAASRDASVGASAALLMVERGSVVALYLLLHTCHAPLCHRGQRLTLGLVE